MALERLAARWGPIFQYTNQGRRRVVISSVELLDQLCGEETFQKNPGASGTSRGNSPAGLFRAETDTEDWK